MAALNPRDLNELDPRGASAQQKCMATQKTPGKWRARTLAVRGGQTRTAFQETSEALFLTSGFAYEASEEAEARFKGEASGFV
jgi:hypothetical protein